MTQPAFIFSRDSHILEPLEQQRLSEQNQRVLARLQQGPASNRDLAAIALKYTSRISDLRAAGYVIVPVERSGGLTIYELRHD